MSNCEIVVDRESSSLIDKSIVALTSCEVSFNNKADLDKCIEAVKESDERLNQRPPEEVLYDWQSPTYIRANTLYFGVRWFDKDYFNKNKDIYKESMHEYLFAKFNVKVSDFKVKHFEAISLDLAFQ